MFNSTRYPSNTEHRRYTVDSLQPLFRQHGAEILQHRLAGPQAFSSTLASWARDLVNILAEKEGSGSLEIRKSYRADVCKALVAHLGDPHLAAVLDPESFEEGIRSIYRSEFRKTKATFPESLLPFAAAAVGNQEIFKDTIEEGFDMHSYGYPFWNVRSAVASTGHIGMMDFLLERWTTQSGHDLTDHWHGMCIEPFAPAIAFAIRASHPKVVQMIYDFVARLQDPVLTKEMKDYDPYFMSMCAEFCEPHSADCVRGFALDAVDVRVSFAVAKVIFTVGNGEVLRHLLQKGSIDPNRMIKCSRRDTYTSPLEIALDANRRDLFKLLLDCGADVGGTPDGLAGAKVSLLWHAANRGDVDRIKFLLSHGANPRSHEGWRTPLQVAKERGVEEIIGLLESV
jgi:hypothetical protein